MKSTMFKLRGRTARWSLGLAGCGLAAYIIDSKYNASSFGRSLRTAYNMAVIMADYKLNFSSDKDISALHERSAARLYDVLMKNQGLYVKMGQAISVQSMALPTAFRRRFQDFLDRAPQDSWDEVLVTLNEEWQHKPLDSMFTSFDQQAVASASVAQVYRARMKSSATDDQGVPVAVKVQHRHISKQIYWDLLTYRAIMWTMGYIFDLPLSFISRHVSDQLFEEMDFRQEVKNSELVRRFLRHEPRLNHDVHIPVVYDNLSTSRVIVMEWIDGVPLSNPQELQKANLGDLSFIVGNLVKLSAVQIFRWGLVHCDMHPGNVLVRRNPRSPSRPQLVLIDHGLYVRESPRFRQEYARFWTQVFHLDMKGIAETASNWGFGTPWSLAMSMNDNGDRAILQDQLDQWDKDYRDDVRQREMFRDFIQDSQKVPLELVFLGRAMRILLGVNRDLGSPVNRVKLLAQEASRSLVHVQTGSWHDQMGRWKNHLVFCVSVFLTDVAFWLSRVRRLCGATYKGMDDYTQV